MQPARLQIWPILAAFLAIIVAFTAGTLVSQRAAQSIHDEALLLSTSAAPSVAALSQARSQLIDLETEALLQSSASSEKGDGLQRLIGLEASFRQSAQEYLSFAAFSGERGLFAAVEVESNRLGHLARQLIQALQNGLLAEARSLGLGEFRYSVERTDSALDAALRFNLTRAEELGAEIDRAFNHSQRVAYLFDAFATAFALLACYLLVQSYIRTSRLQTDYVALQRSRAEELELFAARVAHDIRSPLAALQLQLEVMRRDATDEHDRRLRRTEGTLNRLQQIVEGLYEFARAGSGPANEHTAFMMAVVEGVVDDLELAVQAAGQQIVVEAVSPVQVKASEGVVTNLLANLVQNAVKHAAVPNGRITLRVRDGAMVRTEVADSGPGLAPDVARHVFDPYWRGQGSTPTGLGLGLATVRRLVEAHGGRCGVDSALGRGCTFWFELPRADVKAS